MKSNHNTISPGRLMMIDLPDTKLNQQQKKFLNDYQFRGVCLFRRNIQSANQVIDLIGDIRNSLGKDALIAIDQEGGAVMRTTFLPDAPSAMSLGVANDLTLTEQVGYAVGKGIASFGVNINFAPVLDVNCNPNNPVIAERSFGNSVELVISHASAWAKGLMRAGVASCGKHFPGHGDTIVDSHLALPSINKSIDQLNQIELAPFRALANILPMMMSAHVRFPKIDQEFPATLSALLINKLLRKQLNFHGVIVSDALNMHAVSKIYGQGSAASLALAAGIDLALVIGDSDEIINIHQEINQAIENKKISNNFLSAADTRLTQLANNYPIKNTNTYQSFAADQDLMLSAWQCGIAQLGLEKNWQGIPLGTPLRLIGCKAFAGDGISEAGASIHQLAQRLANIYPLEIVEFDNFEQLYSLQLPDDHYLNILISLSRKRYPQKINLSNLALHLALWNPYCALDLDIPSIISFGLTDSALNAIADAIEGKIKLKQWKY